MNPEKWRVKTYRFNTRIFGKDPHTNPYTWAVLPPGIDEVYHEETTHYANRLEALEHAERMSRTVTLVLPRVRNPREIVTNGYRSFISRQRGGRIWLEHDQAVFCILPEEAEAFAQTILALHYHHERNQK